jgi:hypothetical protein
MLPKNLQYGSKVESAVAKSSKINIAPQNGTNGYGLGDTIIFNIPTRNNLVLVPTESYLKFTLNPFIASANNSAFRLDSCGIHGVIQRIRVWHGSNLLQDIDNYGMLAKMLMDIQLSTDASYGKNNILVGTRSDMVVTTPLVTALAGSAGFVQNPVLQINSGELIRKSDGAVTLSNTNTTQPYNFAVNLISLIGSLCNQQYIPLFAMTSAPLRVEITLVDNFVKFLNCVGGAPTVSTSGLLSNVEYVANFIELGDSAINIINSSLQGQPLQFVYPDYRNYIFSTQLGTSQTQVTMPIPAKFSSLKSIFITIRDQSTGGLTYYPFSSVTASNIDYQFRIGPMILPPKAPSSINGANINAYAEHFAELLKAVSSMSDINHQPSIEKTSYTLNLSAINTVVLESLGATNCNSGSFYIGIDLENYSNADKSSCFAGINTNTDDIFAMMTFAGQAGALNTRFDAYACYDCVFCCENGVAYTKF